MKSLLTLAFLASSARSACGYFVASAAYATRSPAVSGMLTGGVPPEVPARGACRRRWWQSTMSVCIVLLLCSIAVADDARDAAKEKLQPLQDFVGEWKGAGQRERGRSDGGWIEKSHWAWSFSG